MSCLDTIVSLGICPDEDESLSGFKLIQAAGISPKNLAAIANETYTRGVELALEKKELSLIQFQNDFIGALQANRVITTQSEPVYTTAIFNTAVTNSTYAGYRGQTLHRASGYKGYLRQTIIKAVQCYPLASGDAVLNIQDGFNSYSWAITLTANQTNTFDADLLDGFPFIFPETSHAVRVTIDNTTIPFASAKLTCMVGCNGTLPNPCGWVDGWDGERPVKEEGYGINLQFYCHCDYLKVICDLSKAFTGELIWLKWQINVFEEQLMSNRFSNLVIYGHEELQTKVIPDLYNKYNKKWNDMMNGLFEILKTYKDDCLQCRGVRWHTNI